MSGSRLIIPGHVPEGKRDDDMVRYEMPLHDGTDDTRYVSLVKKATLRGYFDEVFTKAIALTTAMSSTPQALLAHGLQCLWCFMSKNHDATQERIDKLVSQLENERLALQDEVDGLEIALQKERERVQSVLETVDLLEGIVDELKEKVLCADP